MAITSLRTGTHQDDPLSDRGVNPLARALLSLIFIAAGVGKLLDFEGNLQYLGSGLLPASGALLAVAIIVELVGGLMLLFGIKTRIVAAVLALYLVPVSLLFHTNFSDQTQIVHFLKNLAIIGGLTQMALATRVARTAVRGNSDTTNDAVAGGTVISHMRHDDPTVEPRRRA